MKNPYDEMKTMTVAEIRNGLGAQAIIMVGIGLGLWWASGRELTKFIEIRLYDIGLGIAFGLGLIAIAASLFHAFPRYADALVRMQARNFAFLENRLSLPMIIFLSICAGVGEEALFRAGIQTLLADYIPLAAAIVLSSLLFMLIHFAKPVIAALIFVIGALFGVAYWWSGSLLAVMIAHTLYDIYAFWYLQREMHRLKLFESSAAPPANPPDEV